MTENVANEILATPILDTQVLDTLGQLCPWPLVLSKKALSLLPMGATLEVWADDPLAELDLRALCVREGHHFESVFEREAGGWAMRLVKMA